MAAVVVVASLSGAALQGGQAQGSASDQSGAGGGFREAAWSPDGAQLAVTWFDQIWITPNVGDKKRVVTNPEGWIAERDPAWSPDGTSIAFSADTNGEWDLWVVPATGGAAKRLTTMPGDERWPSWTRDGRVVFSHRVSRGPWQLFLVSADRLATPNKLTPDDAAEWQGRVSPDGKLIAFISDREAGTDVSDVWVRDLPPAGAAPASPSRLTRVTNAAGIEGYPSWSPSGDRLAYYAERPTQSGVWVSPVPADAGPSADTPVLAWRGAGMPAWAPSGPEIVVTTFPFTRAAYNGDPRRNDDDLPITPASVRSRQYLLWHVPFPSSDVGVGSFIPNDTPPAKSLALTLFDETWQTLKSLYYVAGPSAPLWDKLREKYRPQVAQQQANWFTDNEEDLLDRMVAEQPLIKSGARSSKAVITSGNPLASQAGAEILAKGGNLVDAAIATSFALGVTEPDASSIGGDGMCLLFLKGMAAPVAIDYKDMSPAAAGQARPAGTPASPRASDGPAVTNIPGVVAGLDFLYQKYGSHRVKWADLLAPAIRIADEGFILDDALPTTIREGRAQFSKYPESAKVFMPGGKIPKAGDRFVNKDYANTLRIIAKEGGDTFYRGSLAKRIADDFAANGGAITAEDLAQYHAVERTPVSGMFRGHRVYSAPPPVPTGAQMVATLEILDNYTPKPGATYATDADYLHYLIEAWRARDNGARIGDPDRMQVDLGDSLTPEHALERFKLIDPKKSRVATGGGRGGGPAGPARDADLSGGTYQSEDETGPIQTGTTSFALADTEGDMIVFTQTLSTWGGNFYVTKDLGFLYNDHFRGGGGTPHTRSSSTSVPTMLFAPARTTDENRYGMPGFVPKMASGCAGNSWIPASVYNIISNVIDGGMDAQHAIEAPRLLIGSGPTGARTQIEDRIPRSILADLEARGHTFQKIGRKGEVRQGYASVVIIDVAKGTVEAGAEPRRSHGAVGIK